MSRKDVIEDLRSQVDAIVQSGGGSAKASNAKREAEIDERNRESIAPGASGRLPLVNAHEDTDAGCNESSSASAMKKIINLVNASDKSERAIRDRLARAGFGEAAIEEAVSDAKRYGFIDDQRYASVLIRSRVSQMKGSAGIVRELSENGIVAEEVPGWPYEFCISYDEELERALSLLDRKPPRSKNRREGAYRRLMQKGYPSSVSSSAARMWSERCQERTS